MHYDYEPAAHIRELPQGWRSLTTIKGWTLDNM